MEIDVNKKPQHQQSPRVIPIKQATTPQPMNFTQSTFYQQKSPTAGTNDFSSTIRDTNPLVDQFRSTYNSMMHTFTPEEFNDYTQVRGDYNRFAHLLQFKNDLKIKKADVMNTDQNEALQKLREKIRNRTT